jgi:hypothetical protein
MTDKMTQQTPNHSPVTDPSFNPSGSAEIAAIKQAATVFENVIRANTQPGRRTAVALTHLETSVMWAVKSAIVGDA